MTKPYDGPAYDHVGGDGWARLGIKHIPGSDGRPMYVRGILFGEGGAYFPRRVRSVRCGHCRVWGHNKRRCPVKWLGG